ncbi:MAG: EamA family transporter [Candidatus Schekmanbacteria bacterium]|nr:EamA family transporter [Candidatus Schekmanbacteria bacterium]
MSILVFLAVIGSAAIQASWNVATKRSRANKAALLAVGWTVLGAGIGVAAAASGDLRAAIDTGAWKFALASGLIHGAYILTLSWAYAVGELSVVFPVARGVGIAGTAVVARLALGTTLSWAGWMGVGVVVAGTSLIGLCGSTPGKRALDVRIAVLVGAIITAYSSVDSMGARRLPILVLLAAMNLVAGLVAAPVLAWRHREATKAVLKAHKLESLGVAVAGSAAYGIVIWAFRHTAAAYIVALREVSIVIAAGLSVGLLGEALNRGKIAGIGLIFAGVIIIKLGA